ncbi:tyrosine-type recombinase/integrase [Ruegeria arenilitoris]|uniref:tyrosine-type recombinase/integrase n=1 Tax=Ruegeria arenilitoris TaxID=1173585 RepID=UPI00147CABFD|nr:site-specific integrase [Ruegeria arenilitoris]
MQFKESKIYKRTDGAKTFYRLRWYDPDTRARKEVRFSSKSAALKEKKRIDEFIRLVSLNDGRVMTFATLARQYVDASRNGRDGKAPLEFSTLKAYQHYLERHILPVIGSKRLLELSRDDMSVLMERLICAVPSRRTASHCFNLAKGILNWAVARDLMHKNPAFKLAVQVRSPREKRKGPEIHSRQEMAAIMAKLGELRHHSNKQVRRSFVKYSALFSLMATTGLRISEALGLKRDDFDDGLGTVTVQRRVDQARRGRKLEHRIGLVKSSHAYRTVPVAADVRPWIRDQLLSHNYDWVFSTKAGTPVHHSAVNTHGWYRVQREANVRQLGVHSLRHYFASELMAKGKYLEAQKLLGHHDAAFTMTQYGHLVDDGSDRLGQLATEIASSVLPPSILNLDSD